MAPAAQYVLLSFPQALRIQYRACRQYKEHACHLILSFAYPETYSSSTANMLHQWLHHALGSMGTLLVLGSSFAAAANTVDSTILILARTDYDATSVSFGLEGYGIPWEKVLIPKEGIDLPTLNSSEIEANYGGIVVVGDIAYEYEGSWQTAITDKQWAEINAYQTTFNVRLVRLDEYPGEDYGEFFPTYPHLPRLTRQRHNDGNRRSWLL